MYDISYFKEKDGAVVLDFIRQYPFAFITGCDADNKPVVTQIPVFIDERNGRLYLSGHIMKNTDHHKAFEFNSNVLAVFTGPHTYISASWYDTPKQVSTWNYTSVHAKGRLNFLDEQALLLILKRTTDHFENNPNSPANYDNIPPETIARLSKAIVAFEIEVTTFDNVFKLSQNRNEKSYHSIIEALDKRNDPESVKVAEEMKKRIEQMNATWHKK
jgi:transcriptional regulator